MSRIEESPDPAPAPVPVLVLAGAARSGKTGLLMRWARQVPQGERWTVVTRGDNPSPPPLGGPSHVIGLAHDCACCNGQLILKTHLNRTLRMRRPDRLLLEVLLDEHLPATLKWLSGPAWQGWLGPVRCMALLPLWAADPSSSGVGTDLLPLFTPPEDIALKQADLLCFSGLPAGLAAGWSMAEASRRLLQARSVGGSDQWRIQGDPAQLDWGAIEAALGSARAPV